jgi:hypothetical protein
MASALILAREICERTSCSCAANTCSSRGALASTSAYISMRQHTRAYVSIRGGWPLRAARASRGATSAYASIREHTRAYVSMREHTWRMASESGARESRSYVSIRQHSSAYVSIRGGWPLRAARASRGALSSTQ